MTIPALWPELEAVLPAGQTHAVYDSAVKYFLSLEETWEIAPTTIKKFPSGCITLSQPGQCQKSLKHASQHANVDTHPNEVYAFHEWDRNEAALVASVEWISCFPTVITRDIDSLVLHAAVLGCAQADALDMCVVSLSTGDRFPNPVITAMGDIQSLYTWEVILYEERCWHLEKFAREHNKMLEGRQAICDWVAASSQALADESPGLAQLAWHTGGAQSTAPVLGDDSDADGIGKDDLMLLLAYEKGDVAAPHFVNFLNVLQDLPCLIDLLPGVCRLSILLPFHSRFYCPLPMVLSAWLSSLSFHRAQRLMADPSLFLPPGSARSCGQLVLALPPPLPFGYIISSLLGWDDICSAVRANGEDQFREAAEAFCLKVATEAMSVASVDWVCQFPSVASAYTDHLVLHAAILCCAQQHILNLYHWVVLLLGIILDPFALAQDKINRSAKIRDWTAVLAPLLSQFAAAYHLPMIAAATPDPSNDGPDYEEWLDFSSGDVSLLALEQSWLLCCRQNSKVTAWLCLFQSAWDAYDMSATLVQEDYHCADAKRFCWKVVAEALPVASVDWIWEYPSMSGMSAGLLATHAAAVLQAQRSVIHAYCTGIVLPGSIPHPLDIAKHEIQGMLARAMISFEEYQWHILRFAGKHYDEDPYDDLVSITILGASGAGHLLLALHAVARPSPVPEESSDSVSAGENTPIPICQRAKMERGPSGILKKM
ncbi:hypothetical protein EI94DRAFT_1702529 [Lactarius quietus]|nr:hypothetical protein EI94DRAFT_1702529 [Lactarius quietus]